MEGEWCVRGRVSERVYGWKNECEFGGVSRRMNGRVKGCMSEQER